MKDYDEITAFLRAWGCFQKIVFFLLCATFIPNGLGFMAIIFVGDIPSHHCLIPEVNLTQEWHNAVIPVKYDLVCNEQWKQPFTTTVYFIGVLCGFFFSGQISDRFGRKPVLFATMAVQTIFTVAQIFSSSWTTFTILHFFFGLGEMSNYLAAFVLGTEILRGGNVRILYASMGVVLFYVIGYMMLPLRLFFTGLEISPAG